MGSDTITFPKSRFAESDATISETFNSRLRMSPLDAKELRCVPFSLPEKVIFGEPMRSQFRSATL